MTNAKSTNHGFIHKSATPLSEINGTAHIFEHQRLGTRLLFLETDDNNKVFSAAFPTPPTDSTGVPHIVEHSVLSGSRKYKTKEPFMDLVKGSLQTFLNAMTFSDKTIYPVASRNDKDFSNLVDVYLDSVFFPKIYEDPEIFMQEGWHFRIDEEKSPLAYNGVVYNEMKGAYSDPYSVLSDGIAATLFPETCYAHSSGGTPEAIVDLSYEAFVDFHKKYYHPSQSLLFFYGNLDIQAHLTHIEEDYFSHFEAVPFKENWVEKTVQNSIDTPQESCVFYPLGTDETEENKHWLSQSYVLGDVTDAKLGLSAEILKIILVSSTAGPIKQALLDKHIGEDITCSLTDSRQIGFSIIAKNTNPDKKEVFINTIETTLEQIVKNGLDPDLVEGSIQIAEYALREASNFATKGIIYHINSLSSWLYGKDPLSYLSYNKILEDLRKASKQGYFEDLISNLFLKNSHKATVVLVPQKGLNEKREEALVKKLSKIKENLSADDIKKLIGQNASLTKKQTTPDSPEALATIPSLTRDDIEKEVESSPLKVVQKDSAQFLHHDLFSSGIAYVDMVFDMESIDFEDLPYASLLCALIGKIDTKKRAYSQLANATYLHTGGISLSAQIYSEPLNPDGYYAKVLLRTKYLKGGYAPALSLVQEILTESLFQDKKRIRELIQRQKSKMENVLFQNGHSFASQRVLSYVSSAALCSQKLYGLDFYWFLSEILSQFDAVADKLIERLNHLQKIIFSKNSLLVSFTGSEEDFNAFLNGSKDFVSSLWENNTKGSQLKSTCPPLEKKNEGIVSTATVQYVAKGGNLIKEGFEYAGDLKVLSSFLNTDYLHNRVRAQGGAYGCSLNIGVSGNIGIASYRDPRLVETLSVYDDVATYLENLEITPKELEAFIIGTVGRLDPARSTQDQGFKALIEYITKVTTADRQKEKDELLATTPETLKSRAPLFRTVFSKNNICVLGNETKIKNHKEVFSQIRPLNS